MGIYIRLVYCLLTLYMLLILIRWSGPWLNIELKSKRLAWISTITDPLIEQMRKLLPSMGPVDFGPLASLVLIWLVRALSMRVIFGIGA